ncbi:MAG TPA: hypothetical protein VMW17_14235 [Candidatus Binatia bacterium]|nr:hypothetical protein [Candidatus Binatia bacterium]
MRLLRKVAGAGAVAMVLASWGCVSRYVRIQEKGLTCAEAHRVAIAAVRRMSYTIDTVTKPTPGSPGVITASRSAGTGIQSVVVNVFCTSLGAEIEAQTDQGGVMEMSFPEEFQRNLQAATTVTTAKRAAAETGLDVLVAPERALDPAELGSELSRVGVLAVSVRISNRTPREYAFRAADVVLQTDSGERVAATSPVKVAEQISPSAATALRQQVLQDRKIGANETAAGLLCFPFQSYTRARVTLTDRSTDEPEGFSIEF